MNWRISVLARSSPLDTAEETRLCLSERSQWWWSSNSTNAFSSGWLWYNSTLNIPTYVLWPTRLQHSPKMHETTFIFQWWPHVETHDTNLLIFLLKFVNVSAGICCFRQEPLKLLFSGTEGETRTASHQNLSSASPAWEHTCLAVRRTWS